MLAQITLTPTESKKLIAKAIANMEFIKKAATEGMIVLHPSSSTYFIVEEITGTKPKTNYWVCGVVTPRGNCVEMGMLNFPPRSAPPQSTPSDPGGFRSWWVIREGKLSTGGEGISELLEQIRPTDAFIKGVNALDPQGNIGILIGDPAGGGGMHP